jgi:hypothetical protein
MLYTRREFGKVALASLPSVALLDKSVLASALVQAKPNSRFGGVQIGTITYSYRSMPDQSAEATLKYITDSGISAVELMGGPVNDFARKKTGFTPSTAGRGGGGRAGGGGGGGGRAGRGAPDPATLTASWNGVPCAPGREGGEARGGGAPGGAPPAGGAPAGAPASGAWACRWTSSRNCGRCTTTPA